MKNAISYCLSPAGHANAQPSSDHAPWDGAHRKKHTGGIHCPCCCLTCRDGPRVPVRIVIHWVSLADWSCDRDRCIVDATWPMLMPSIQANGPSGVHLTLTWCAASIQRNWPCSPCSVASAWMSALCVKVMCKRNSFVNSIDADPCARSWIAGANR